MSKHGDEWVETGRFVMVVVVGLFWFLGWRMGFEWSQARMFEIPLLDGGEFQPFFEFPHKRERRIQRIEVVKVVKLGEHGFQSWVPHIEDHGCHCRVDGTTKVLGGDTFVVLVDGDQRAHLAQTMA